VMEQMYLSMPLVTISMVISGWEPLGGSRCTKAVVSVMNSICSQATASHLFRVRLAYFTMMLPICCGLVHASMVFIKSTFPHRNSPIWVKIMPVILICDHSISDLFMKIPRADCGLEPLTVGSMCLISQETWYATMCLTQRDTEVMMTL